MQRFAHLLALLMLASCGGEGDAQYADPVMEELPADAPVEAVAESEGTTEPEVPLPPARPSHYYDAQDGLVYSYIAALSEDDRKAGKAAGEVVSFSYLGLRGGHHALARVTPTGKILSKAYCPEPCVVITYSNGSQIAFNESSIIGAAFADAIAGRLQIAQEVNPWERYASARQGSAPLPTAAVPVPASDLSSSPEPPEATTITAQPASDGVGPEEVTKPLINVADVAPPPQIPAPEGPATEAVQD